jgi:HAD superfamily hydrolase (TIGR01509 family)
MNRIESVVFDMDGLMVDSEPVQFKALNDALKSLGISVTKSDFIDMVGRKSIENFRYLQKQYRFKESPETLEERKNQAYFKRVYHYRELKSMPGLFPALEVCEKNRLELIIASSSPANDVRMTLEILGLENRFSIIVSGDQVKRGKPDPEIFLKVAKVSGKAPGAFVVLEDTGHGVNAAKAAGMFAIAVPNSFTYHHDFSKADLILASLEDLSINIINRLPYHSSPK